MLTQLQDLGVKEKIFIPSGSREHQRSLYKSQTHNPKPCNISMALNASSSVSPLKCSFQGEQKPETGKSKFDPHSLDPKLLQEMGYDALVWSSLHGLVVGDRASQVVID